MMIQAKVISARPMQASVRAAPERRDHGSDRRRSFGGVVRACGLLALWLFAFVLIVLLWSLGLWSRGRCSPGYFPWSSLALVVNPILFEGGRRISGEIDLDEFAGGVDIPMHHNRSTFDLAAGQADEARNS